MKTLIAIPCMDYMEADFVECLTNLRTVGEVEIKFLKASLVYDARNQITQYAAAKGGFDYVLWLDSDMTFAPDLMERLLADLEGTETGEKLDAVTGLCFSRRPPFRPCIYKRLDVQTDGKMITPTAENWEDYPRNELFEVAACGFACLMMRMDVLEKMGIYGVPFFPVGGLGEDLTFCWRAKKVGVKFHCDTRLKIGHIMRISIDEDFRDNVFEGLAAEQ